VKIEANGEGVRIELEKEMFQGLFAQKSNNSTEIGES
jgi:hypothetical protein